MITEKQKLEIKKMNKAQLNRELHYACIHGHINIVKYLLTSPDLTEHADINYYNGYPLQEACYIGHLEVVKYLLTSPELKYHADIHTQKDLSLRWACMNGHLDIINYLIFDYGIERTKYIEEWLINGKREDIMKIFNKRDLGKKLQLDLNNKDKIKRVKI